MIEITVKDGNVISVVKTEDGESEPLVEGSDYTVFYDEEPDDKEEGDEE